ncbi:MAG: PQQ-binding-like beta-propeller repeat protein, partial [Candidatus Aenigmarchaeota archaeon]|nr:PQQ-binding-like beta-propeller repeat protein [Candidatus Aenigmarchaeota archaeon]NIQ17235.1 PQQ-binding-like beta-propeller repeat protein [Candidatus Aenigmarchaeota archaeon]NIS73596.1 PQQ-binding-like beta-propeller repeat protein [Candidatus Aenigmarchaeota archaeon]
MDIGFEGFETTDFDAEIEDVEVKRTRKFTRIWNWSPGGSTTFHIIYKDIVYFPSMDSYFYAVNLKTRKLLWKYRSNGPNGSPPSNIYKNMVCFSCFQGNIYCLDIRNGKEVWRFNTGDKLYSRPEICDDVVYFGSKTGYLYALNVFDGSLLWRFKTGGEIASGPCVYKEKVMVGGFDGYFYCLDRKEGKELWRFKTGGEILMDFPATVHNGVIYVTSHDSYLYAIDVETGKEIWRFKTGKFGNNTSAVVMGNSLVTGSRDGYVYRLTMEGKEIWRFRAKEMLIGISIVNNRIYFGSEDGNLYCLDSEGKEIWRHHFGKGGSYDAPSMYNGMLIACSMDCYMHVLDPDTGEDIWRFATSTKTPSVGPPPHEQFEIIVKKESSGEEVVSQEKYKSKDTEEINLSDYHITSEYSSESEYKQKSDYDAS